jgi:hypothetical protein
MLSALSTCMPYVMPRQCGTNAQLSNSCCCVCIYDQPQQAVVAAGGRPAVGAAAAGWRTPTSCMNFLQTGRMSLERVAENIITCFSWGVFRKISCTSRLISKDKKAITFSTSKIFLIKKDVKNVVVQDPEIFNVNLGSDKILES